MLSLVYIQVQGCPILGEWPSTWETNTTGEYTAYANFSSARLSGSLWKMCVGNGWREDTTPVYYDGVALVDFLTVTNSTVSNEINDIEIESDSQQTVIVDFNTHLSGGQSVCYDFPAYGNLTGINVSMYFGGASISNVEFASDMMMTIYGATGSVEVGGFDDFFSNVTFGGFWDESWYTSNNGTYTDFIDVSGLGVFGNGMYNICITNGYYQGEYAVIYNGISGLLGVTYNPIEPSSEKSSEKTPITETAAFIVPITLMVVVLVGGIIFYFFYKYKYPAR